MEDMQLFVQNSDDEDRSIFKTPSGQKILMQKQGGGGEQSKLKAHIMRDTNIIEIISERVWDEKPS